MFPLRIHSYCTLCPMATPFPPESLEGGCLISWKMGQLKQCQAQLSQGRVCHCHWVIHGFIFIGVMCVSCSHHTSCGHPLCQLAPMRSMEDWSVGIGKSIVWWSGHSPQLRESQAQDPALMNAQLFMQSRKVWQNRLRKSIPAKLPTWGWKNP